MADNNEYNIYVHFDGDGQPTSAMAGAGNGSTDGSDKPDNGGVTAKLAKRVVSFAFVKSTADRIANFEHSQIQLRTGAVEYGQRISTAYSIISETVGAGAALALGAIHGGPAGFAVAAMGVALSGVNKIIGLIQKEQQLSTERSLENISIGLANIRAGVSGSRAGRQ